MRSSQESNREDWVFMPNVKPRRVTTWNGKTPSSDLPLATTLSARRISPPPILNELIATAHFLRRCKLWPRKLCWLKTVNGRKIYGKDNWIPQQIHSTSMRKKLGSRSNKIYETSRLRSTTLTGMNYVGVTFQQPLTGLSHILLYRQSGQ